MKCLKTHAISEGEHYYGDRCRRRSKDYTSVKWWHLCRSGFNIRTLNLSKDVQTFWPS